MIALYIPSEHDLNVHDTCLIMCKLGAVCAHIDGVEQVLCLDGGAEVSL